jgi:C1A family cysteine protease
MGHKFLLKRDTADVRDFLFENLFRIHPSVVLPASVDLTNEMYFPVFDQGQLGSCGANAMSEVNMTESKQSPIVLSRLFIYYVTRLLMNTVSEDSGVNNRMLCKAAAQYGICLESEFPYDITKFTDVPPAEAFTSALNHRISTFHRLATLDQIKQCLALTTQPVLIGINVYESFETPEVAKTGIVPMPKPGEQLLGGHDVAIFGYDDAKQCFKVLNSWGEAWGDKGFFYLPYAYLTSEAFDYWMVNVAAKA